MDEKYTSVSRVVARLLAATAVALAGCATQPTPPPPRPPQQQALPPAADGTFAAIEAGIRATHGPEVSGFELVDSNQDGLRWRKDPSRPVLLLYGGREMPLRFEIVGPRALRPLDLDGRPIGPGATNDLTTDGKLAPAGLSLGLHGMFRYMADAARFEECLTGRSYPVAMEGDYLALERAYGAARKEPGAPLMASFDGSIVSRAPMEGPGPLPTVVVRRFVGVWPGQTCERAMSRASLGDQYWRVVSLRGTPIRAAQGRREPHLILRSRETTYAATAGCDRLVGTYRVDGDRITFAAPAARSAACPPEVDETERALIETLHAARKWSIQAQVLELFDASGASAALFEAIYLR